jgi:Tfp pilus assembly protein PilF
LAGARKSYERALEIDENVYGPDHPNVATIVNNLGGVLRALGDLAGARKSYERALEIDENVYGPDHPEVATDVNNLGLALQKMGDLESARENLERSLEISRHFLGENTPPRNSRERTWNRSGDRILHHHDLAADPAGLGDPVELHPRKGIDQTQIHRLGPRE